MPISYTVDHSRDIICEIWSGTVDAAALAAHWKRYLADPEVMACRRTLIDLSDADIAFTGSTMSDLVQTIVLPALGDMRWVSAILVGAPVQHGTSRQYQVFAEAYSNDAIFSDRQEAEAWLSSQHP